MFIKLWLLFSICLMANVSHGQSDTLMPFKTGKYKVTVKLIEKQKKRKFRGYPIAITDSGLWMTRGYQFKRNSEGKFGYKRIFIDSKNLDKLFFRRKGTIGWGLLAGAVTGTIVGANIASSNLEEPRKPLDGIAIVGGGILGFEAGSIAGSFIGSRIRKRFNIRGNVERFIFSSKNMLRYLPQRKYNPIKYNPAHQKAR